MENATFHKNITCKKVNHNRHCFYDYNYLTHHLLLGVSLFTNMYISIIFFLSFLLASVFRLFRGYSDLSEENIDSPFTNHHLNKFRSCVRGAIY